jgi:hypothetical protein
VKKGDGKLFEKEGKIKTRPQNDQAQREEKKNAYLLIKMMKSINQIYKKRRHVSWPNGQLTEK